MILTARRPKADAFGFGSFAAAASFAGGWAPSAVPSQIIYYSGCGTDAGKTILSVTVGGVGYFMKSDLRTYPTFVTMMENALTKGEKVQLYYDRGFKFNFTDTWIDGTTSCAQTAATNMVTVFGR